MQNVNRSANGRWLKGTPPLDPAGRPLAARQRISEKLLSDLAGVWEEHCRSVLERLVISDPGKLTQIAYGLLPSNVFISVEPRMMSLAVEIVQAATVNAGKDQAI